MGLGVSVCRFASQQKEAKAAKVCHMFRVVFLKWRIEVPLNIHFFFGHLGLKTIPVELLVGSICGLAVPPSKSAGGLNASWLS